jgi:hypothetical protein
MADSSTITDSNARCLEFFGTLLGRLDFSSMSVAHAVSQHRMNADAGSTATLQEINLKLQDESARFKIWSETTFARESSSRSFDRKLTSAVNVLSQVKELFEDLIGLLEEGIALLPGGMTSSEQGNRERFAEQHGSNVTEATRSVPEVDLETITTDIEDVVGCLLRLTAAVKDPAPQHQRAEQQNLAASTATEADEIQTVRRLFGECHEDVIIRLAWAAAQRREDLARLQEHFADTNMEVQHDLEVSPETAESTPSSQDFRTSSTEELSKLVTRNLSADGVVECALCYSILDVSNDSDLRYVLARDMHDDWF